MDSTSAHRTSLGNMKGCHWIAWFAGDEVALNRELLLQSLEHGFHIYIGISLKKMYIATILLPVSSSSLSTVLWILELEGWLRFVSLFHYSKALSFCTSKSVLLMDLPKYMKITITCWTYPTLSIFQSAKPLTSFNMKVVQVIQNWWHYKYKYEELYFPSIFPSIDTRVIDRVVIRLT